MNTDIIYVIDGPFPFPCFFSFAQNVSSARGRNFQNTRDNLLIHLKKKHFHIILEDSVYEVVKEQHINGGAEIFLQIVTK